MAKYAYIEYKPHKATLDLVQYMNLIIDSYIKQGYTLSVRQLYYQLVARDKIANTEQSYKRIASIINDARMGGLIDWDVIEDRNRDIVQKARWETGGSIIQACASQYHMDMWAPQENRVFVIVEKAALAGVLDRVCREYDVPLLAARGYPSVSIVRELVLQYIRPNTRAKQEVTILHMGDHDPSGIDMTRDLTERIDTFMENDTGVRLKRIALTMPQIEEKNPPPNPAKSTDSRFADYREKYGVESWELDALEPAYLANLVTTEITQLVDRPKWDARLEEIRVIREKLQRTADHFDDLDDSIPEDEEDF